MSIDFLAIGKDLLTWATAAKVAIGAFAMGITFAIGTIFILIINGLHLGTIFGACHMHGLARQLLTFVYGHGPLELSAIFICGGGGLLMGKALLFPGRFRRIEALKMISKDAFSLLAGCIPLFLIAGTIEGFVSPQETISATLKYTIGMLSFLTLGLYLLNGITKKST